LIYDEVVQMIGKTPHVRVQFPEAGDAVLYIKLEGQNPTGSIKDRTCIYLLRDVLKRGELRPGMTVLDASSGNLGCALAYYSRLLGYESFVVSSAKLTAPKRDFILYYGARIHQTGTFTIEGNQYCRQLAAENPGQFCFLDQLHNWNNSLAHYETTAPEILGEFSSLAMVVGSLGSGGSLLGIGQYFKGRSPDTLIVAVQAAPGTKLPGTASLDEGDYRSPFIEKGYRSNIFDYTVKVTEADAIARTIQLRNQGIFCGLQTGGVVHAALEAIREKKIKGNVVLVSGDSGWKNMDKLLAIQEAHLPKGF
jgi:cysteine synthase